MVGRPVEFCRRLWIGCHTVGMKNEGRFKSLNSNDELQLFRLSLQRESSFISLPWGYMVVPKPAFLAISCLSNLSMDQPLVQHTP